MTILFNHLAALTKLNDSFDEFQSRFNPQRLHELLTDLCNAAGRSLHFYAEINELIGESETALENISVEGIPTGKSIVIPFGSTLLHYTLTANDVPQSVAPYIIKAPDLLDGDSRSWIKAGSLFGKFTQDEVDANGILTVQHNFGFPFFHVMVFDGNGQKRSNIIHTPTEGNPNNSVDVSINQGFEGEWKVLITY